MEDLSWTKGRRNMRYGGQFTYIQPNEAYGACAQAVEQLGAMNYSQRPDCEPMISWRPSACERICELDALSLVGIRAGQRLTPNNGEQLPKVKEPVR